MNEDRKIVRIQLAADNVREQHHGRLPKAAAKHYGNEIVNLLLTKVRSMSLVRHL